MAIKTGDVFKKGDLEIKLGEQVGDTFKTDFGTFSQADLANQGFSAVAPVTDIKPPSNVVSSATLAKTDTTAPTTADFNRQELGGKINQSIQQATPQGIANEAFVQGIAKYKLGRPATADELKQIGQGGAVGGSIRDVLRRFGALEDFNVLTDAPTPQITAQNDQNLPSNASNTQTGDNTAGGQTQTTQGLSASQKISNLLSGLGQGITDVKEGAREAVDLTGKSQAIANASTVINDLRTALQNQQIIDIKEQDVVLGKPILTSQIQGQLDNLSREQKLDLMITQNNYNNALVDLQIAQGNFDRAESIVKDTADDYYRNAQLQLDALEVQGAIEKEERTSLNNQLNFERELALGGYTPISIDQANAQGLLKADLFTDPVTGKTYKKPTQPTTGDFEIKDVDGVSGVFNKDTGAFMPFGQSTIDTTKKISELNDDELTTLVLTMAQIEGYGADPANRPTRNNNPLNIKVPSGGIEEARRRYNDVNATIDQSPATDGGQFIVFSSADKGIEAAKTLLTGNFGYGNLGIDNALKRWSNNGYGAEILDKAFAVSDDVKNWASSVADGTRKFSDVPEDLKGDVNNYMVKNNLASKTDIAITEDMNQKVAKIDDLISKIGTDGKNVVGPTALFGRFRFLINPPKLSGREQEFVGGVKQLVSQETLDTLINLKREGGTLGALSDQERIMLQNAATTLGAWEKKNDQGVGLGVWNISEKAFARELNNIKILAQKAIERAGGDNGIITVDPLGLGIDTSNTNIANSTNPLGI